MALIWLDVENACCDGPYRSHEQLLAECAVLATAWLVDEITGDEWGDDWNDAPACCNAGRPYEHLCVGLRKVPLALGQVPNIRHGEESRG